MIRTWFNHWIYQLHAVFIMFSSLHPDSIPPMLFHLHPAVARLQGTHIHLKQQYLMYHATKQKLHAKHHAYISKYVCICMFTVCIHALSTLMCSMVIVRFYFQCMKACETVMKICPYFYRQQLSCINLLAPYCSFVSLIYGINSMSSYTIYQ